MPGSNDPTLDFYNSLIGEDMREAISALSTQPTQTAAELSRAMTEAFIGMESQPPQAAAVPARQDAVPDGIEDAQLRAFGIDPLKLASNFRKRLEEEVANGARLTPRMLEAMRQFGCKIPEPTQPTQTAVGGGELPRIAGIRPERLRAILNWREPKYSTGVHVSNHEAELLVMELREANLQRDALKVRRHIAERERDQAIAQRDEAQVLEGWHQAEAALQCDRAEAAEARLAAATEFKPDEIERLIDFLEYVPVTMLGVDHNNAVKHWLETRQLWLSRLRSLPSEPSLGNRKAAEK